jgi:PadR family transcriptional regulator, regulatory protein PadR
MSGEPRVSTDMLKVLGAMLEEPIAWHYGLRLAKDAKIAAGTIYPMLARLERAGWLESKWEKEGPENEGRPRRRLYHLTGDGERAASEHLEEIVRLGRRVQRRRRSAGQQPQERLA